MASLGEVTAPAATDNSWADALKAIVPTVVSAVQQNKVMTLNLKRAQQGLAPLQAEDFAPGVKVGLDASTQKMLGWGLAILLGVGGVAFMKRKPRRA